MAAYGENLMATHTPPRRLLRFLKTRSADQAKGQFRNPWRSGRVTAATRACLDSFQSGRVSAIGKAFSGSCFSALGQSVERYVGHLQPSGPVVRPRPVHFCRPPE
jgi:hypothetical protein